MITVLVIHKGDVPLETWVTFYNGEKEHTFVQDPKHDEMKKRALPMELNFTWKDETGRKYYGKNTFDEEEIFRAYKSFYESDPNQEAGLVFTLNEQRNSLQVVLRSQTHKIELFKGKRKAFPSSVK